MEAISTSASFYEHLIKKGLTEKEIMKLEEIAKKQGITLKEIIRLIEK
jgi:hypothetical protein